MRPALPRPSHFLNPLTSYLTACLLSWKRHWHSINTSTRAEDKTVGHDQQRPQADTTLQRSQHRDFVDTQHQAWPLGCVIKSENNHSNVCHTDRQTHPHMARISEGKRDLKQWYIFVSFSAPPCDQIGFSVKVNFLLLVTKVCASPKLSLKYVDPTWMTRWESIQIGVFQEY